MLGVFLWSDANDRKAVIWCEDQGDLAYMNGTETVLNDGGFFDAGDMVQFDMCLEESTRRACNPRLVMEKASASLPIVLRNQAEQDEESSSEPSMVIPFPSAHLPRKVCA